MTAEQAPLSLGFSRQEHWSGLPFPSPIHESEKWKWSRAVVSDSQRPNGTAAHQAPPSMGFSRQEYWSLLYWLHQGFWFWITANCGKFLKKWGYQTTLPTSWEICMQVRKQQLELDMEQQTGSKLGKEYVKAICRHPADLTYLQSTSCEMPGWMRHKLESRLLREISITSDTQMTPPLWQKVKRN